MMYGDIEYANFSAGEVLLPREHDPVVDSTTWLSLQDQIERAMIAGIATQIGTGAYDSDIQDRAKDLEDPDSYQINPLSKPGADITEVFDWFDDVKERWSERQRLEQVQQQHEALKNMPQAYQQQLIDQLLANNPSYAEKLRASGAETPASSTQESKN